MEQPNLTKINQPIIQSVKYWPALSFHFKKEKNELTINCSQLKIPVSYKQNILLPHISILTCKQNDLKSLTTSVNTRPVRFLPIFQKSNL